jgi:Rieske Fe-S protein
MSTVEECDPACPSRRTVLAAAGAVGVTALTGCQTYGETAAPPPLPPDETSTSTATAPAGDPAGDPTGGPTAGGTAPAEEPADEPAKPRGKVLASLSDIPIGGGAVFANDGVVVTHPREGTVRAFSATCTHAGCAVSDVENGTINCPCHGSKFRINDGSVAAGPARRTLPRVKITVDGDNVRLA